MIENKAFIHTTIGQNELDINSNLHQTKVITPIALLTSTNSQAEPSFVFVNTTGKTIFGFRVIQNGSNILTRQRIYNKESITIPIYNYDDDDDLIISYSFYKNKQKNEIFMSLDWMRNRVEPHYEFNNTIPRFK